MSRPMAELAVGTPLLGQHQALNATVAEYNSACDGGHDALFVKDRRYLRALRALDVQHRRRENAPEGGRLVGLPFLPAPQLFDQNLSAIKTSTTVKLVTIVRLNT